MCRDRLLSCQWLNISQNCQNLHRTTSKLGQSKSKSPSEIHSKPGRNAGNDGILPRKTRPDKAHEVTWKELQEANLTPGPRSTPHPLDAWHVYFTVVTD